MSKLSDLWQQEAATLALFCDVYRWPGGIAFGVSDLPEFTFWNLAYVAGSFTWKSAKGVQEFYQSALTKGHFVDASGDLRPYAQMTSLYFERQVSGAPANSESGLILEKTDDLRLWATVLQESVELDDERHNVLMRRLAKLHQSSKVNWFIATIEDELCGAAALVDTPQGNQLILGLVLRHEFRGRGLGKPLVQALIAQSSKPLIGSSRHPLLKTRIFPDLGFLSVGQTWLADVDEVVAAGK